MAPPFQMGDSKPLTKYRMIKLKRSLPSCGTSLNVRFALPRAVKKPHMARMAVILARGKYLRPGTQSSGRAQYTTKNALNQKKAALVGSATWRRLRQAGISTVAAPLLPLSTLSSFPCPQTLPDNEVVILSEAKDLLSFRCTRQQVLRSAPDDNLDKECIQRIQIAFLPVTKLTKATTAAELRTTNVRAASATRDSCRFCQF